MKFDDENAFAHYGILRRSGRWPWGSRNNVPQRAREFLNYVDMMKAEGLSEKQIAEGLSTKDHPFTTADLRATKSIALAEKRASEIHQITKLRDKGWSTEAIAKHLDMPEPTVRTRLAPGEAEKAANLKSIADSLQRQIDAGNGEVYIDVGTGQERHIPNAHSDMGVSETKLKAALIVLKERGYVVRNVQVPQLTGQPGQKTTIKVLAPPNTTYREIVSNMDRISHVAEHSKDHGRTWGNIVPPLPVKRNRIKVAYAEDGGAEADGTIYIRPGVSDLSMGHKRYAQVRISVEGTHYIKGMAVYKDDLPPGVDIVFNTNKSDTGNMLDALKPMQIDKSTGEIDKNNPFGATISRQITETDSKGREYTTSALNIIQEEGKWDEWSDSLSSQVLAKQRPPLVKSQLALTREIRETQLQDIMSLTNPVVRRHLLLEYADAVDSSAVKLEATALPGQSTHVILPVRSMKPTEIYAKGYTQGEKVALIRFPHGGTFEIPELIVNNRNPEAKKLLGDSPDAVGINHQVAARLSGADFDGDTVLVIPNGRGPGGSGPLKSTAPLEGLKDFDPQREYPGYEGMKVMKNTQTEMGKISNLITDMTIKAATPAELARAVRHSMVVIDAEKKGLNYKLSEEQNGIAALKEKYQRVEGRRGLGASTLISNAGANATVRVPKTRLARASEGGPIDPKTGRINEIPTNESYYDKRTGKTVLRTQEVPKLMSTRDVEKFSSNTQTERLYVEHHKALRSLADRARKEAVNTPKLVRSPSAARTYAAEVSSLRNKLREVEKNRPLERQAQVIANHIYNAKVQANPDMTKNDKKRAKSQALAAARYRTRAERQEVEINWDEWNAIQAGAISDNMLTQILRKAKPEQVRELARPRENPVMTSVMQTRAKAMLSGGYSYAEIAKQLGIPESTIKSSIRG